MLPGGIELGGFYCGEAMSSELQKALMALRAHTAGAALLGAVVSFDPEPAAKLAVLKASDSTLPTPAPAPVTEDDPTASRMVVRLTAKVAHLPPARPHPSSPARPPHPSSWLTAGTSGSPGRGRPLRSPGAPRPPGLGLLRGRGAAPPSFPSRNAKCAPGSHSAVGAPCGLGTPPPPPRTNRTRLVPSPVLSGHVSSLLPY